ncbi:MAG: FkbM family methyltransferase, partial [Alphaproteobacteria bacterium]|nr:FkbM family methyltransferase [Alphaproteobacteria bacterium]
LLRWTRWQVGGLLRRGERVVPFVDGARLALRRGMTGATQNLYCGLADYKEMAFLLHLLRPHDLFVDVGANVGVYTILAAAAAGADVVCFEPQDAAFTALQKNIALNKVQARVQALKAAAAAADGSLWLGPPRGPETKVATAGDERHVEIQAVTLDGALAGRIPRLIKIDVEGYEIEVLKGAPMILADPGLLGLIVEVNGSEAVVGTLAEQGFRPALYDPQCRSLRPLAAVDPSHVNTVFVRDLERVTAILRQARSFTTAAGTV